MDCLKASPITSYGLMRNEQNVQPIQAGRSLVQMCLIEYREVKIKVSLERFKTKGTRWPNVQFSTTGLMMLKLKAQKCTFSFHSEF